MKISSINSYHPNFGYDSHLNKELSNKLKHYQDKKWANMIKSLNTYCNKVENNIINAEIHYPENIQLQRDAAEILFSLKGLLAGFVAITFPELNFPEKEYNHYNDTFVKLGSKDDDWRKPIILELKSWVSDNIATGKEEKKPAEDELVVSKSDYESAERNEATSVLTTLKSMLDKKSLLEEYKPSATSPKNFNDVAGMDKLKQSLKEGIVEQINNPEQAKLDFEEYGKTIPKALLLYGPPGCGKTYITQALSGEINAPMFLLNISKAGSYYINETSNNIKSAFDEAIAISQKENKTCLLFMDEIDSLGFNRTSHTWPEDIKQVATLLQSIDNVKNANVIIIGATNKYNILDPAIRRRFDEKILVDVPDKEAIIALLKMNLSSLKKGEALRNNETELNNIAKKLSGFSNSSICAISKQAALNALRRNRAEISVEDYEKAISETTEEKPERELYLPDYTVNSRKIGFN